jgi:hypothetical protein
MWNVKTNVMQVVIGVTGNISKSFSKYLNNISGKHEIKELQSHIGHYIYTSESINVKYETFSMGNIISCAMNYNNRIAATLHTLEIWFVSGIQA